MAKSKQRPPPSLAELFRENVKKLLQINGWSAADLARAMGVSNPTISVMLNKTRSPRLETVENVAKALQVVPVTLLIPQKWKAAKKTT